MSEIEKIEKAQISFTPDQVELIKRTIAKGCSDDELKLFLHICSKMKLDPFLKHAFAVKRWDSKEQREVMSCQVSIDGARLIADRTGKYEGQVGPFWSDRDGKWVELWAEARVPYAAKVGVWKTGFREPLWSVAKFDTFAQKTKQGALNHFWRSMPEVMIAKVAEMNALRKAFPADLAGLVMVDELTDDDRTTEDSVAVAKEKYRKSPIESKKENTQLVNHAQPIIDAVAKENGSEYKIPFGKYLGKTFSEIPESELTTYIADIYKYIKESEKELGTNITEMLRKYDDWANVNKEGLR